MSSSCLSFLSMSSSNNKSITLLSIINKFYNSISLSLLNFSISCISYFIFSLNSILSRIVLATPTHPPATPTPKVIRSFVFSTLKILIILLVLHLNNSSSNTLSSEYVLSFSPKVFIIPIKKGFLIALKH